jgi:hypothetical protein
MILRPSRLQAHHVVIFCTSLIVTTLTIVTSEAHATRLRFDADARLEGPIGPGAAATESQAVKAGETVTWPSDRAVIAESPGHVPVLILPISSRDEREVDVKFHSVRDWPSQATQAELDRATEELASAIVKLQKSLARNAADEALSELDRLQAKYPRVQYLNFYRASALFLKGDRKGALSAVNTALEAHPDNADGQALRKTLGENTGGDKP